MRDIPHFIDGEAVIQTGGDFGDVFDPNTGEVQARVGLAGAAAGRRGGRGRAARPARLGGDESAAARAGDVRVQAPGRGAHGRARGACSRREHGKVLADSRGDVQRGLEVVEFACGIPHALKGEYTEGAGPGIDVYSMRQPLGVAAGITPFNFPAMIPMWMFAVAIAVRQRLHPEAVREGPQRAGAAGRALHRGGRSAGHPERGARRQGGRGRHPRAPRASRR